MENNCIVLADKHQNVLEGLRGLLESLFNTVVMVADQPSLVEALDKIKPQVAIVDVSLFSHSELATAFEINRRFPNVHIIVLSDYDDPHLMKEIMDAGVSGFVLKRRAGIDLDRAILEIQKGHIFISSDTNKIDIERS